MSDLSLPANEARAAERPLTADERPIGRSRRTFSRMAVAVILIFWTLQFTTLTISRLVRMPEESWSNIQPRAMVTACAILLSFGILAVLRAARGRTLIRRALIAVALAAAGCGVHTAVNMGVFMLYYPPEWDYAWSDYLLSYALGLFDFVWFYSALSVILLALTYGEDLVENEDRIAKLQAQANVAQLNALRYQLNPHFLFNTLNSVASLIGKKQSVEAESMVVSLSDFLRSTLRMDTGREITLGEELKLQSLYLDIEKIRFPQRLNVTIDVPAELNDACVPNLITQPLFENAIKHGVARSSAPVHLEVIARAQGNLLTIEVRDDGGDAENGAAPGTQVGLRNVAERLRLRYGAAAGVTAGPRREGGFSARIQIPLRRG